MCSVVTNLDEYKRCCLTEKSYSVVCMVCSGTVITKVQIHKAICYFRKHLTGANTKLLSKQVISN